MIAFRDRVKVIIKIFENITGKKSSKMGKCERVYPNNNIIIYFEIEYKCDEFEKCVELISL